MVRSPTATSRKVILEMDVTAAGYRAEQVAAAFSRRQQVEGQAKIVAGQRAFRIVFLGHICAESAGAGGTPGGNRGSVMPRGGEP